MSKWGRLKDLREIVDHAFPGLDLTPEQKQAVRQRAAQGKCPKKKKYWWALTVPVVAAAVICAVVIPVSPRSVKEAIGSMSPMDDTDLMTGISPSLSELLEQKDGEHAPALGTPREETKGEASTPRQDTVSSETLYGSKQQPAQESAQAGDDFAQATTEFSLGLLRESRKPQGNTLISPASAALALGMTANGTSGNTLEQFLEVLGQGNFSLAQLNESYADWKKELESDANHAVLNIANSIWFAQGFQVKETFLRTNANYFDAGAYQLDFSKASAAQRMNEWVSQCTNGKIAKLVEQVDPASQMYLLSTVYLNMNWDTAFSESATKPMEFRLADGTTVTADFMQGIDTYLQYNGAKGIKKAYCDTGYQFVAVMPGEGVSLEEYLDGLTAKEFLDLVGSGQGMAEYELPKFRVEDEHLLNDALQKLGLTDVFTSAADFSSLSGEPDGLYLEKVVQKAVFSVDETGTKAAAGTYAGIMRTAAPVADTHLTFDRPFFFTVLDESGIPVFLGTVTNP